MNSIVKTREEDKEEEGTSEWIEGRVRYPSSRLSDDDAPEEGSARHNTTL